MTQVLSRRENNPKRRHGNLDIPSDENLHQPSSVIDPSNSTIEPEFSIGASMLVSGALWTLMVIAVIFLVTQLLW